MFEATKVGAANGEWRSVLKTLDLLFDLGRCNQIVRVQKLEISAPGQSDAGVSGGAQSLIRLKLITNFFSLDETAQLRSRVVRRAVVNYDHFERRIGLRVGTRDRFEYILARIECGDDDANQRLLHLYRLRRSKIT